MVYGVLTLLICLVGAVCDLFVCLTVLFELLDFCCGLRSLCSLLFGLILGVARRFSCALLRLVWLRDLLYLICGP